MVVTFMLQVTESQPLSLEDVRRLVPGRFRDMVKGVVDLKRRVLVLDADMHADQEALLLADGSQQRDLWGINLRPSFGNRSRSVDDPATQDAIVSLVEELVRR